MPLFQVSHRVSTATKKPSTPTTAPTIVDTSVAGPRCVDGDGSFEDVLDVFTDVVGVGRRWGDDEPVVVVVGDAVADIHVVVIADSPECVEQDVVEVWQSC